MTDSDTTRSGWIRIRLAVTALVIALVTGCGNADPSSGDTTTGGSNDGASETRTEVPTGPPVEYTIHITDMSCDGCEATVSKAAKSVPGTEVVNCDHESGELVVKAPASARPLIEDAIRAAQYEVADESGDGANH